MCLIPDSGDPPHHQTQHHYPRHSAYRREDEGYPRDSSSSNEVGEEVGGILAGDVGAEHERHEGGDAFFPDTVAISQEQVEATDEHRESVDVKVLSPEFGHVSAEGK